MLKRIASFCAIVPFALFSAAARAQTITAYTFHEPPMNFTDAAVKSYVVDQHIKGFAPDVVREIMARTGHRADMKIIPWIRSYKQLETEPNVVLFAMARTPQREHQFQWVGPLARSNAILYVRRGSGVTVRNLDDARKLHKIGVTVGDSKEQFLLDKGFTNVETSSQWANVFQKMLHGRVPAIAMTDLDLPILAREAGVDAAEFEPVHALFVTRLYIGVSKATSPALVRSWQLALDDMKHDGSFQRLAEKWSAYTKIPWAVVDGAVQAK